MSTQKEKYVTIKVWSSGKKTSLKFERFRIRAPLIPLDEGKYKYIYKCFLI